ncbi:MFS transporter [Pseudomaricurvus alcaniphilus]|uniref:MFS transporter n=1 Tax=Pseudomaricurvus alcaniphilus TaxID=1166482 RepID=UPI001407C574|nr:MFS transporter [Pseudomaricurvus alcaniphilus]NHN39887.1 MFS transporter [Pseudomaricurvus alcaniphilus]
MHTSTFDQSNDVNGSALHETRKGIAALVIGHCAGLMDITALPIWVGIVLVGQLALEPQSAGLLLTLFLGSVVVSSLFIAPRVTRLNRKVITTLSYTVACISFATMPATSDIYIALAAVHIVAGLSVGCGLSIVHGTMGCTKNPHRTAAIAFTTLSLVSIFLMASIPPLVTTHGPNVFFYTMSGIMLTAAAASVLAFPTTISSAVNESLKAYRISKYVWFTVAGVSLLMVSHSMVFGFIERVGNSQGFSSEQVTTVLVVSGFVNLIPVALSGLLERHLPATSVIIAGPIIQAISAFLVTQFNGYGLYIVTTSILISIVTFTHVFAFGVLSKQDPSGRVVAATPVMVMVGSATGPLIGGVLAQHIGYSSLGWAAVVLGVMSAMSFYIGTKNRTKIIK